MTENDSILIEQFAEKLRKLMDMYESVKSDNRQLKNQLEARNAELEAMKEKMAKMDESYMNLKQSKVLEVSGHDLDNTKRRISGLVREIDHCIDLLNTK